MAHIKLPEGLPGIVGPMTAYPETEVHLNGLTTWTPEDPAIYERSGMGGGRRAARRALPRAYVRDRRRRRIYTRHGRRHEKAQFPHDELVTDLKRALVAESRGVTRDEIDRAIQGLALLASLDSREVQR